VATMGPASGELKMVRRLVKAGVDVFRINFSHGNDEQRKEFLDNIRKVESETGAPIAVMGDLCGPKIRIGPIAGGSILLAEGQQVVVQREPIEGTVERVSTTMAELIDELDVGQVLLLDDGKIRLEVVESRKPDEAVCKTIRGGVLSGGKGMNLPHAGLSVSALTENDRRNLKWISKRDFDYVAMSFVRSAEDVGQLRRLMVESGCKAHIVSKIEKPRAVDNIEEIVEASDAVMVARGDLGVEMELPAVPIAQKRIARLCQQAGKPCIIATQMLETMTHSAVPTRAEVSDVANAVLDHADAVMLSGETAVGEFPVEAVGMMNRVVQHIQSYHDETYSPVAAQLKPLPTTAALAGAVRHVLEAEDIAAVAVFTATGATARMLAKCRLPRPIIAFSPDIAAVRRMCLYYGVFAARADAPKHTREVLDLAAKFAINAGIASKGEKIVVLTGRPIGQPGATNTLVVHSI